jgi:uncharacterized membrane protein (GlpM family)
MEPKFKMASIIKKCHFLLAVMYLFLGRFEKKNHFGLVILDFFILMIKRIKDATEIQDGVHSKKNVIFFFFLQIKPFWTYHTQLFYIIDKKKLKMQPKFKMTSIVRKMLFAFSSHVLISRPIFNRF